jgi:hypothetical protein
LKETCDILEELEGTTVKKEVIVFPKQQTAIMNENTFF